MRRLSYLSAIFLLCFCAATVGRTEETPFQILFNGEDLSGWKGLDSLWSVHDGAIVGQTTEENPVKSNTFLIWQGGEIGDFEFRCLVRFEGNNSGVQYRSKLVDAGQLALAGYQADLHPRLDYMGMMYGEKTGRGIIATGGQRVVISAVGETKVTANLAPIETIQTDQWNELRIIAAGNRMIHQINGVTTVDVSDDHADSKRKGLLGLQLHAGPAMKAEFRNLLLRKLDSDTAKVVLKETVEATQVAKAVENGRKVKSETPPTDDSAWLKQSPKPQWVWAAKSAAIKRFGFASRSRFNQR